MGRVVWKWEYVGVLVLRCAVASQGAMAMQNMVNKVKSTALGVAEHFTPVLKVLNCVNREKKWEMGAMCVCSVCHGV